MNIQPHMNNFVRSNVAPVQLTNFQRGYKARMEGGGTFDNSEKLGWAQGWREAGIDLIIYENDPEGLEARIDYVMSTPHIFN